MVRENASVVWVCVSSVQRKSMYASVQRADYAFPKRGRSESDACACE